MVWSVFAICGCGLGVGKARHGHKLVKRRHMEGGASAITAGSDLRGIDGWRKVKKAPLIKRRRPQWCLLSILARSRNTSVVG
jgi:hypothetical protein